MAINNQTIKKLPEISISIVSHLQSQLIHSLLNDLELFCLDSNIQVILTINIEEKLSFDTASYKFPIQIIWNNHAKGFGENHNAAFLLATGHFFCILNPDIRLMDNPFNLLTAYLDDNLVGLVAPVVLAPDGRVEDSLRQFPSPLKILRKVINRSNSPEFIDLNKNFSPDWAAGMFMLLRKEVFLKLNGFDESFFLYYEDVDLCARLKLLGYVILACPQSKVIHHAQRQSHRSFKYLRWHVASMLRFFFSSTYRQLKRF